MLNIVLFYLNKKYVAKDPHLGVVLLIANQPTLFYIVGA